MLPRNQPGEISHGISSRQDGFGRQFDGIFSSAYVGYMKHDTAFFEHVLRELKNVKAQEILFGMTSQGIRVSGHSDLCSSILELEAILTLRRTVPPLLS